ncbi:DUF3995 domain-containing protein [Streptomyces sp. NPDC002785]|uniref:DUF3995 domain-containing protein n=1 Tax=Streptomyces sp. NPDC002785 TaxID=3154543 RepID=UPI00332C4073
MSNARADATSASVVPVSRWERTIGYCAVIAGLAYALPHLWWGLGIMVAYPDTPESVPDVAWQRMIAFWGMGAAATLAALATTALFRPWGDFFPRWLRIGAALTAGTGLALWGLGYGYLRFFIAVGRVEPSAEVAASFGPWNFYWYPVFFVWGASLALAALHLRHRPRRLSAPGTDVPQPDGQIRRGPSTIEVKP